MSTNRKDSIIELLNRKGSVTLLELTDIFPEVSSMTLRRDLINLEESGVAIRVKGGAILANKAEAISGEESAYGTRERSHREAKLIIASKAKSFLETGRSIYLDAGSTIMAFASQLDDDDYSFVTSGINVAQKLLDNDHASVIVIGGYANKNTLSLSGPLSSTILDSLNIDIAFISASGFTMDNHFTVSNIYEAELKKQIIAKAKKVIVLMDNSKIGKSLPYTFAKIDDIDVFITEDDMPTD
ncbi:MAG: DeoR/GlpR family DNA-binding transcription regulator, partial [Vallitaleaceae bacterium]|nr:DeoR/GlpR family DNA-binding transcription regulator [Vallitaleaceae bacterium]